MYATKLRGDQDKKKTLFWLDVHLTALLVRLASLVGLQLFTRALDAENVGGDGVVMVHPTCGPTQADDIPGDVR